MKQYGLSLFLGVVVSVIPPAGIAASSIEFIPYGIQHHDMEVVVDGTTQNCRNCHDGMIATYADYCTEDCTFRNSHSISRLYPPPGTIQEFAAVEEIAEAGIRLVEGRTSCVSCHDLRKSTRYHLVIDNSGSRLCMTCHRI